LTLGTRLDDCAISPEIGGGSRGFLMSNMKKEEHFYPSLSSAEVPNGVFVVKIRWAR